MIDSKPKTEKTTGGTIFGWAMYDWANSAYATTTVAAVLPAVFSGSIVPEGGYPLWGRFWEGQELWAFLVSFRRLSRVSCWTPMLGAIADFTASKKRFLRVLRLRRVAVRDVAVFRGQRRRHTDHGAFFLSRRWGFVGANVFYDGFLPDISTPDTIDRVSARGYALRLSRRWAAVRPVPDLDPTARSLRNLGGIRRPSCPWPWSGVWWFRVSPRVAFTRLRETGDRQALQAAYRTRLRLIAYVRMGFWAALGIRARKLVGFRQLSLFSARLHDLQRRRTDGDRDVPHPSPPTL